MPCFELRLYQPVQFLANMLQLFLMVQSAQSCGLLCSVPP